MKKVMSIGEFMTLQKLKEIESLDQLNSQDLDVIAGYILKDKNLKRVSVVMLGIGLLGCEYYARKFGCVPAYAGTAVPVATNQGFDRIGNSMLKILKHIGYWSCLLMGILEVIRCMMNGNMKSVSKVTVRYIAGFLVLYLMPILFDTIRSNF